MKLTKIYESTSGPFALNTEEEIRGFLDKVLELPVNKFKHNKTTHWDWTDNGIIVDGSLHMNKEHGVEFPVHGKMPFKVMKVKGAFSASGQGLSSWDGIPIHTWGSLVLRDNEFATFGDTRIQAKHVDLMNNKFETLHNIHKGIHTTKMVTLGGNKIRSHILGLFLIDELTDWTLDLADGVDDRILHKIMRDHAFSERDHQVLLRGDKQDRLLDVQEALMEAGLDEYAQL